VIRGFIANIGDTITKGAVLKAKYIDNTPAEENIPETPKKIKLFLEDLPKSVAMCRENIMDTYINPNSKANAVATRGAAYSVVICLPNVWATPYDTAALNPAAYPIHTDLLVKN